MSAVQAGGTHGARGQAGASKPQETRPGGPRAITPARFGRGALLVAGRELAAAFDGPVAYVYLVAFTLLANGIFMNEFFLSGNADMRAWFELMPLLLAFFLPAVTMRLVAEERRQRTLELLLTLPIVPGQAVLGKFLAAFALYLVLLSGSLPIVVMLGALGDPDLGLILCGYLGLLGLGAMFVAFGLFLSSLSGDQIVAFVSSTLLGFAFVLTGQDRVAAVLDGLAPAWQPGTLLRDGFSVVPHYEAFVAGAIPLSGGFYFAAFTLLFLWLTALVLQRHRA